MRNKLIIIVAILAIAVAAGVVTAQGPRGGAKSTAPAAGMCAGCPMGMGFGADIATELNLSQDQIKQMKQIRSECMTETKTPREQLQAKMKQMPELWTAEKPDASAIKALLDETDALRAEIRNTAIDSAIRAYNVLTPDQQTKVRAAIKARGGKMMGCCMGGFGFGPGMGSCMGAGMGPGKGMGQGAGCPMGAGGCCPKTAK